MSIKGRVYYRETNTPPKFKQIIKVLSSPVKDRMDQLVVKVNKFNIDYSGFKFKKNDDFGDFEDNGEKEGDGFIKPIENVDPEKLRDFIFCLFENRIYEENNEV